MPNTNYAINLLSSSRRGHALRRFGIDAEELSMYEQGQGKSIQLSIKSTNTKLGVQMISGDTRRVCNWTEARVRRLDSW